MTETATTTFAPERYGERHPWAARIDWTDPIGVPRTAIAIGMTEDSAVWSARDLVEKERESIAANHSRWTATKPSHEAHGYFWYREPDNIFESEPRVVYVSRGSVFFAGTDVFQELADVPGLWGGLILPPDLP